MKKAEIERHWRVYSSLIEKAQEAERRRRVDRVVKIALASCAHVDGALRQLQKNGNSPDYAFEGIVLVLRYAPLVFEFEALDQLEQLLKTKRRFAKQSSLDLFDEVPRARALMWHAHAIWDFLEREHPCEVSTLARQIGDDGISWRPIIDAWEHLHIVRCYSANKVDFIAFGNWARGTTIAKCPECGVIERHDMVAVLEGAQCRLCGRDGVFVRSSQLPPATL
jgi:hypothetical protein